MIARNRLLPLILLVSGVWLCLTAVALAQDDPEPIDVPDYMGTRDCNDCHRDQARAHRETLHALTLVEINEDLDPDETPILGDFTLGADAREVIFPDGDQRAFEIADVAYTLGAGRNLQAYLFAAGDNQFYVYPAKWNVTDQAWEQFELADEWPSDAYAFGPNCAGCHTVGVSGPPDYEWEEDAVMCEACHGPGEAHVDAADDAGRSIDEEEYAVIFGAIDLALDAQTCGQCHTRGLSSDGVHPYPTGYYPGLTDLADHYEIVSPDDETHWWATGHASMPNMQFNEWLQSSHGNALESVLESDNFGPDCMTCHSATQSLVDLRLANDELDPESVDPLALADAHPFGVTCASCHDPHQVTEDDDAAPPARMLRDDGYALCVSCHSDPDLTDGAHHPVQQVFEGAPITPDILVSESPHFSAEDGPTCVTCHLPEIPTENGDRASHTFAIVAPGDVVDTNAPPDSCSGCHDQSPATLQNLIDDLQSGARERIQRARDNASDADPDWVTIALDVIENEGSFGIHNYAYTTAVLVAVEQELGLASPQLDQSQVLGQIEAALPDIERADLEPPDEPLIEFGGLTTPSIALIIAAALIFIYSTVAFFRSK